LSSGRLLALHYEPAEVFVLFKSSSEFIEKILRHSFSRALF
jgi:hypothetical protein